jgi:hypothetical protein
LVWGICLSIEKNLIIKKMKTKKDKPWLLSQEFQMTFTQDADCCDSNEQYLTIKTQNGGGGDFFVIETQRWAFDNIPELINILTRFQLKHSHVKSQELE